MRGLAGRISLRQSDHARRHLRSEPRDARRPRLIPKEPVDALLRETVLPAPDHGLGHARLTHGRMRPEPIGAQQHDTGTPDVLLRRVSIRNERFEPKPIRTGEREGDATAHPARLAGQASNRNPTRTQPSDLNH